MENDDSFEAAVRALIAAPYGEAHARVAVAQLLRASRDQTIKDLTALMDQASDEPAFRQAMEMFWKALEPGLNSLVDTVVAVAVAKAREEADRVVTERLGGQQ